jgi:hypothetical protein
MSEDEGLFESARSVLDLAVKAKHVADAGDWERGEYQEACLYAFLVWEAAYRPHDQDRGAWNAFFEAAWWLLDELKGGGCIPVGAWVVFQSATPVWGLLEKGEADG